MLANWKRRRAMLGAILLLTPAVGRPAGSTLATADRCAIPEFRQFDFWLGRWDSYDQAGNLQGHLEVNQVLDGCVVEEVWRGTDGSRGRSFSIYDRNRKIWNQTWVSNRGTLLSIEGSLSEGSMVLTGFHIEDDGRPALNRTVWTPVGDGTVLQVWDVSRDGGLSWKIVYHGSLRRGPG